MGTETVGIWATVVLVLAACVGCGASVGPAVDAAPDNSSAASDVTSGVDVDVVGDVDVAAACDGAPVAPGTRPEQTAEYMFLDQGLCTGFCERLQQCNLLCQAFNTDMPGCTNDSAIALARCREDAVLRSEVFGFDRCPHACPRSSHYAGASTCQVSECAQAIRSLACRDIARAFAEAPDVCVAGCVP